MIKASIFKVFFYCEIFQDIFKGKQEKKEEEKEREKKEMIKSPQWKGAGDIYTKKLSSHKCICPP